MAEFLVLRPPFRPSTVFIGVPNGKSDPKTIWDMPTRDFVCI
jgi:hypothetical protein